MRTRTAEFSLLRWGVYLLADFAIYLTQPPASHRIHWFARAGCAVNEQDLRGLFVPVCKRRMWCTLACLFFELCEHALLTALLYRRAMREDCVPVLQVWRQQQLSQAVRGKCDADRRCTASPLPSPHASLEFSAWHPPPFTNSRETFAHLPLTVQQSGGGMRTTINK